MTSTETESKPIESIPWWIKEEVAEYDIDLPNPPAVILDIGANVGAYTLRCAKRWPNATIHAYEPDKRNADAYRTHCADLRTVTFRESAVRRFTGQDLLLTCDDGVASGFHQLNRQLARGYYVDCISAAELPEADLIKIDTEGCEIEILEKLRTEKTKAIVCEFHRPEDRETIKALLAERGFIIHSDCEGIGILKFIRPDLIEVKAEENLQPLPFPQGALEEIAMYELPLDMAPETILDIGACLGAYTLDCVRRWPGATIHAYEPIPRNAATFRHNTAKLFNVHLTEIAVRGHDGEDWMRTGKHNCGEHSFYDLGEQKKECRKVSFISAENLPPSDLVKIDTEGCELEILEKLNLDQTRGIICEWHRPEDKQKLIDHCQSRGFELYSSRHIDMVKNRRGVIKFIRPGAVTKRPVKLFLGLPVYSTMVTQFSHCLLGLQVQKPCEIELHIGQGDGVARTRNSLTATFLKTDCTHLLMIDCDLIFGPHHVARIISHDVDVVGGFYPKKQEGPLEWVINSIVGPVPKRDDGLHKVAYIGTGFICVRRRVIEKMIEAYPWSGFCADYGTRETMHDLWPMSVYCSECRSAAGPGCTHPPTSKRYLSEDWQFCQRWLDMGGEVWGDTHVVLKHVGPAIFPLQTQMAEIANPKPLDAYKPKSDSAL